MREKERERERERERGGRERGHEALRYENILDRVQRLLATEFILEREIFQVMITSHQVSLDMLS